LSGSFEGGRLAGAGAEPDPRLGIKYPTSSASDLSAPSFAPPKATPPGACGDLDRRGPRALRNACRLRRECRFRLSQENFL